MIKQMRGDFDRVDGLMRRLEQKIANQEGLLVETTSQTVNSASKNGDLCLNLRFNIEKLLFQLHVKL